MFKQKKIRMIGILGLNHKTASIDIRDLFSIAPDNIIPVSEYLMQNSEVTGIVILATCNRTEIYYSRETDCSGKSKTQLLEQLHKILNLDIDYSQHFYHHTKEQAIKHLFSVISGVDSMVLGENQIVSQIKNAYLRSTEANLTDAILMRLFQKSFECSKRVRTETAIQQGATSVGYVANDLCEKEAEDFTNSNVLIIGAGETGLLSLQNLKNRGVKNISITNRTNEKSLEIANQHEVNPILFSNFKEHLHWADVIIAATNAGKYLVSVEDAKAAQEIRKGKHQWYIDLSVPRNIDKEIVHLPNITLKSVDDLQRIVDIHSEKRVSSLGEANTIIDSLTTDIMHWLNSRSLRPVINKITSNMEQINKQELAEYKKNLPQETADEVEKYTQLLTQKYIRTFIKNLKSATEDGYSSKSLDIINKLFDIEASDK